MALCNIYLMVGCYSLVANDEQLSKADDADELEIIQTSMPRARLSKSPWYQQVKQ